MLSQTETEVLFTAVAHARISGEFLQNISAPPVHRDDGSAFARHDLYSPDFPVSEDAFTAFIKNNQVAQLFADFPPDMQIELYAPQTFASLSAAEENRWRVFFTLSRPGVSQDEQSALMQVTAHCPAGPPNYGSIYLLQKSPAGWQVKFNFGLYNQ